jgi:hypothetical protein
MSHLPFEVSIAQPCHQSWQQMSGSSAQRHCASCDKSVHDFAALTPRQIKRLVDESNGHLCARITRREDGSLVTQRDRTFQPNPAMLALSATLTVIPGTAFAQSVPAVQLQDQQLASASPGPGIQFPSIGGVITDSQGALVVGANVELSLHQEVILSTKSDEAGHFAFNVPAGDYDLKVTAQGFNPVSESLSVMDSGLSIGQITLKPGTQVSVQVNASSTVSFTTIGVLSATYNHWYQRLDYRLRHPIAYAKYKLHHN